MWERIFEEVSQSAHILPLSQYFLKSIQFSFDSESSINKYSAEFTRQCIPLFLQIYLQNHSAVYVIMGDKSCSQVFLRNFSSTIFRILFFAAPEIIARWKINNDNKSNWTEANSTSNCMRVRSSWVEYHSIFESWEQNWKTFP